MSPKFIRVLSCLGVVVVSSLAAGLPQSEAWALSQAEIADVRASVIALNAMIRAEPNDPTLFFERALYQKKLGDYGAASQDLKVVELLGYKYYQFDLYTIRGFCDYMNGDFYKAVEDYNFALKVNPRSDYCYANRACAFLKINRYNLALADCHQAIKLNSLESAAFSIAGECYFRLGQYKYAIDYLTKAIQRNDYDARAYYFRGASLIKQGQKLSGDLDIIKARKLGLKKAD